MGSHMLYTGAYFFCQFLFLRTYFCFAYGINNSKVLIFLYKESKLTISSVRIDTGKASYITYVSDTSLYLRSILFNTSQLPYP